MDHKYICFTDKEVMELKNAIAAYYPDHYCGLDDNEVLISIYVKLMEAVKDIEERSHNE